MSGSATKSNGVAAATMATIAGVDAVALGTGGEVNGGPGRHGQVMTPDGWRDPPAAVPEVLPAVPVRPDPAQEHKQIGDVSADALSRSIAGAADDVTAAGRAVAEVATQIEREAGELAEGIRRCGLAFSQHVRSFGVLAQQVSDSMRSTRAHVLGVPAGDPPPA